MRLRSLVQWSAAALAGVLVFGACVAHGPDAIKRHLWWSGLGPVLPHETFPADCSLCHVGGNWQTLTQDFAFDHAQETGVELRGAHARAACLRCHNDRGPVMDFAARGCAGCHEDVHLAQLGSSCEDCHQEWSWQPEGQIALHRRTRFPLVGVHAVTSCQRCHEGAELGRFVPLDVECVSCHRDDLARATFPDHIALGYVDRCDRCHLPRTWDQAETDN
ncbi:MAG: hypothetical protein IT454_02845 [Planctomycetes bacterium]|nr:hypothetical protein [Planctomycetota bacterium]